MIVYRPFPCTTCANPRFSKIEKTRIGMRFSRASEISQDEQRKLQHDVQVLTDDHIKRIDETLTQKDKEILQV